MTLHPQQGIVVLEVKDWKLDTIVNATRSQVELLTSQVTVSVDYPFEQARSKMLNARLLFKVESCALGERMGSTSQYFPKRIPSSFTLP